MTREEKIKGLYSLKEYLVENPIKLEGHKSLPITLIDYAIASLEQEPCDDCISRQAAENITWDEPSYTDALNFLTEVRDKTRALPSVTPKPKTGHWIIISPTDMYCSECNEIEHLATSRRFCAYCGANMVEPPERNDDD